MQRQNIVRILVLFVLLFAAVGSVTAKSPDGKDHAAGLPSGNYPLDSSDNVVLSSGGPANINVSPLSLASTQATNTQTQQVLTIGNTSSAGSSDLTWTVFEDANGSPELVDWSDNFDSYATGSPGSSGSFIDSSVDPQRLVDLVAQLEARGYTIHR